MSKRNSQEAKRAARERLRRERERQAKRERIRRQLTVAGGTVVALAAVAGIAVGVAKLNEDSDEVKAWKEVRKEKLVHKPKNTSDVNGTTIVIGDRDAPTLEIYEDPRCPVCASFEQNTGETVRKDIENGKYKASFTFGTFIDDVPGAKGTGSKNALSALGAALNVSKEAFLDYKEALYSVEHHPDEREDKFADDDYLLEIAEDVKALKDNASFEKHVRNGTFDRWALEMSDKYEKSPVRGTPAFRMFGQKLEVEGAREGTPITTPEQLNAAVDKALAAQKNKDDKGDTDDNNDNNDNKGDDKGNDKGEGKDDDRNSEGGSESSGRKNDRDDNSDEEDKGEDAGRTGDQQ